MTSYTLHEIPTGNAGVRATLKAMGLFVNKYKKAPVIRDLALKIVRNAGAGNEKSWSKQARAIQLYVQKEVAYRRDIRGVETVQSPVQTLKYGQGDCDDKSVLTASLLEAIGHPTRFAAVGKQKNHFCHVLAQTKIGGRWVSLETTEDWPLGKNPPDVRSWMVHTN